MGLEKVTYVDGTTVITAQNLNAIQDSIIDLEASRTVPSNVRNAIYTLLENAAYATTGLEDEIAVVEAWAEEVTSLTLSVSTLLLDSDTPHTITATTVPNGATVTWSSSNNSVATVSGGIVTGVSNGSCTITASAGELVATCDVTVAGFVELVSISAVYTQSGTVYDTDSVDSLKADLVVTATYDDSSTETIPSTDYTLSGTLEVGTSTITVAYGGKTTTFDVTVSYRYSYSYSNGDINKINGGYADIDIGGQLYFGYDKRSNKINVRRAFYKPSGDNAFYEAVTSGASAIFTDPTNPYKYPIPVPQDAVAVKATVTPSTQFVEISLINYSSTIQYGYVRGNTARWTQGTDTITFNAGDYGYAVVATKYNSAGTTYPTEPTELTIEFLTE